MKHCTQNYPKKTLKVYNITQNKLHKVEFNIFNCHTVHFFVENNTGWYCFLQL